MNKALGSGPWRQRDFRIAWTAGFVNNTGDWVITVGLPVFVFVETGSGSSTAILFLCQLLAGAILGPFGGALVDRWDLRRTLVLTNVAQALAILPLLAVTQDRVWPAFIVMAAQSGLSQLNDPANLALIPRVVERDQLTSANAAVAAAESLARLVGSPLGGVLVAWKGLGPLVVVDAVSFLLVAAGLFFLAGDTSPHPVPDTSGRGVRDGVRTVRSHHPLTPVVLLHLFASLAQGAFLVLFVVFMVETLGDSGRALGVTRGAMAIGALIGSAVIGRLGRRLAPTMLFAGGLVGMGVVSAVFWNTPHLTTAAWVYVVLFSLSGLPGAAVSVGLFTTMQTAAPPHALGRVAGLLGAGESVGIAAGAVAAGALVDRVGLSTLLNAQMAIYLAAGVSAAVLLRRGPRLRGSPRK